MNFILNNTSIFIMGKLQMAFQNTSAMTQQQNYTHQTYQLKPTFQFLFICKILEMQFEKSYKHKYYKTIAAHIKTQLSEPEKLPDNVNLLLKKNFPF